MSHLQLTLLNKHKRLACECCCCAINVKREPEDQKGLTDQEVDVEVEDIDQDGGTVGFPSVKTDKGTGNYSQGSPSEQL